MNRPVDDDKYGEPVVRVMTFNLEVDGGEDEDGRPPERWRAAHEDLLKGRRPDLLFRQEATFSHLNGNRRHHQAERVLGMRGFLSPNNAGRNPTAMYLRPQTFHVHQQHEHRAIWRTPPTHVTARLDGVPGADIVLVSWHAAFNSPRGREREADELSAMADQVKQGRAFIGGGDCNEYPDPRGEKVPPIDWASPQITDRVHLVHRTNQTAVGSRTGCTYLDETLLRCGLHDPARYAGHSPSRPQYDALNPTAGHAAHGQGGAARIDRIYLDPWLIQAVIEVNVIDTTGISDHHAVEVILSRHTMAQALHRQFEPLPPTDLNALAQAH